jgi:hypothetical protein
MGNEMIDHPPRYGGDTQYETIKVIEAWGLGFHLGNAVKYIARAGKKTGNNIVLDLAKAVWYLNRAIGVNAEQEPGQDASDALAMATVAAAVAAAGIGPAKAKGANKDAVASIVRMCKAVPHPPKAKRPAAVKPTGKKAAATVGKEKACAACGKTFTPWRKDQRCCSTTCGKSPKARAAAGAVVVTDDVTADAAAASAAAMYPATCEVCGLGFNPKYPTQKTCSITCAKDLREASAHA